MKKKTTPPAHIKNPAKVAAGKARAASAIRDSKGHYVSPILYNEITKVVLAVKGQDVSKISADQSKKIAAVMSEAKVSAKQIKEFYESNRQVFKDMIDNGEVTGTPKNSNQIEKAINEYKGHIEVGGKEMTAAKAKYELMKFKQFLSVNLNVVDFTIKPQLSFDGKMKIDIPNAKELISDLLEYFGVDNVEGLDDIDGAEITKAIAELLGEDSPVTIYAS